MSHTPHRLPTDLIREYLAMGGPATRRELANALGIDIKTVVNCTQGLSKKGEVEKTRSHKHSMEAIYAISGDYTPKPSQAALVSIALANQPELARVWR